MDADALVRSYLTALETADADLAVSLFAPGAVVHSPLYGPTAPSLFYPNLFRDTSGAHLTLRHVLTGKGEGGIDVVAIHFHFDWRLASGQPAPFDVVDLALLAPDGRITELQIIYDTVDVRPAFEAGTGRLSWRRNPIPGDHRAH